MALDLKLNIYTTDDCRTLVIEDSTGNYSEDNLGGWGELNVFPGVNNISILLQVKVYTQQEEGIAPIESIAFTLDTYQSFVDLPYNSSYRGFKLALPIEELKAGMLGADGLTLIPEFEVVEDALYQIYAVVGNPTLSVVHIQKQFVFKNICSVSKLVSSALTSVNLTCKDCDDSDLEKALLAKSLLESLENV